MNEKEFDDHFYIMIGEKTKFSEIGHLSKLS